MASFEDDDDPANNSGEDSQDEDENMDDADNDEADMDQTMADDDPEPDEDDGNDDDGDEDDDAPPDSPSNRHARLSPKPTASSSGPAVTLTSPSPRPSSRRGPNFPPVRPEALTATTYDIVPTMAAPQSTSINCVAATPDTRWVLSGGSDGYVRMYNWVETANGKVPLTVAQKHPFVDSVMKAGSLTTYWENEEVSLRTPPASGGEGEGKELSPVYALAVQREALWALSGLESGGINVVTCRHQAGTRITTLREHSSAVSVLKLNGDETGVLSGSWDKRVLDWDLNVGRVKRVFPGSGAQISALEVRPMGGVPVPKLEDTVIRQESGTFSSNNAKPATNGVTNGMVNGLTNGTPTLARRRSSKVVEGEDAVGSPDGSLFGDNDAGSLFGEGSNGASGGGGGTFGDDDDDFSKVVANGIQADAENTAVPEAETDAAQITGADATVLTNGISPHADAPGESDGPAETLLEGGAVQQPEVDEANGSEQQAAAVGVETQDATDHASNPLLDGDAAADQVNGVSGRSNGLSAKDTNTPQETSESTFLDAAIDGTIRIWDRRVSTPIARIVPGRSTPPWCMGACWSPDGNTFWAGRRNGTVEEYSLHKGSKMGEPVRTLRFPAGSGAVSAVKAMPNGRGLICASYDILRLYDLKAELNPSKHSAVPFLIVPGHRTGVISALHIDSTCRFMISTAGNRGWEGSSTEVLLGYEINIPSTSEA